MFIKLAKKARGKGNLHTVESLISALDDKRGEARSEAIAALIRIGDSAVNPLIDLLAAKGGWCRSGAIKALGEIGNAQAVEPLISTLKDERIWSRRQGAKALGKIGDPRAVEPLAALLSDTSTAVIVEAASALEKLGDSRAVSFLIDRLADEDEAVRARAAAALGALGDSQAVEPLINLLSDKASHPRITATYALRALKDPRAFGPFSNLLSDEDRGVRAAASGALGALRDPRAVEPLVNMLNDEDDFVQRCAAEALGCIGNSRAVMPLINLLASKEANNKDNLHRAIARALGHIGDSRAVIPLINLLANREVKYTDWLRRVIIEALEEIGKPAGAIFIKALTNEDATVRWAAEKALEIILTYDEIAASMFDRQGLKLDTMKACCFLIKEDWHKIQKMGSSVVTPAFELLSNGDLQKRRNFEEYYAKMLEDIKSKALSNLHEINEGITFTEDIKMILLTDRTIKASNHNVHTCLLKEIEQLLADWRELKDLMMAIVQTGVFQESQNSAEKLFRRSFNMLHQAYPGNLVYFLPLDAPLTCYFWIPEYWKDYKRNFMEYYYADIPRYKWREYPQIDTIPKEQTYEKEVIKIPPCFEDYVGEGQAGIEHFRAPY